MGTESRMLGLLCSRQTCFVSLSGVWLSLCMGTESRMYKLGLLCPWKTGYEFSCFTSAAAVSIAIDKVHADPNLNADGKIQLR